MSREPMPLAEQRSALSALGELAGRELSDDVPRDEEVRGRRRFLAALPREPALARKRWLGLGAGLVATTLALLALVVSLGTRSALTYEVDAPVLLPGDYLLVPSGAKEAHVTFSDGSELLLAAGARARIAELSADGAEIGLEEGKATLEVTHRSGARWSVIAGPFSVAVTGTAFDVGWSGAEQRFEVALRAGAVTVQGPLAASGIALSAGQRLIADLGLGALRIEELSKARDDASAARTDQAPEAAAHETAEGDRPSATAPQDETKPTGKGSTSTLPAVQRDAPLGRGRSWTELVAAGDFRGVLEAAETRGLETVLGASALGDLVALADAARYAGRLDVARRALLAQRERFGGSNAARTAAYLLGRLDDTGEVPSKAALSWYDRYLGEAPAGEFAPEALGRKLVALEKSSGSRAAKAAAAEYLRRFPNGPYRAKARALTLDP